MTDRKDFLKAYSGEPLRFMEVCGTHTAEISRNGITELLPPEISLISGPGCPVCVTVTDYIDRLVWLARQPETTVVSFGDLLRVPGSRESLADARADGGSIKMAYSPLDILKMAKSEPKRTYVFAAVGFETTAPVYAVLLENAIAQGIENIRLLTVWQRKQDRRLSCPRACKCHYGKPCVSKVGGKTRASFRNCRL